ncbi:MAG: phosphate ABC transporter, permease protein PstA, partial [Actinobacteria bacterium]|nr:phosphate ABC transporter, permease protein PstA [Actinomycetota bacterium]
MATLESVPDSTEQLRLALTQVDPGRRRKDLVMRVLVYIAFALAMVPLVSLIWSVLVRGLGRFDAY